MAKQGEEAEELELGTSEIEAQDLDETEGADAAADGEEEEDLTWMQDGEPDPSEVVDGEVDGAAVNTVPEIKHIAIKQKLKGKLKDEKAENETLKARILELEAGGGQTAPAALEKPVRPRRDAFENDAAYEDALDIYDEDLIQFIPKVATVKADDTAKLQARYDTVQTAVDSHLDRAAKLIDKHSIDPDVYHAAQNNVKQIIGLIKPGGEEHIFNEYVERLGEGSEKVMFHIGNNKKQLNEFERLFRSDPSGLSAAMFLAEKKREIAGLKNTSSRAPKPAANLKGGEVPKVNATAAEKKYKAAHKKGQNQEAFNIKRQAKAAGVDVSSW